MKRKKKKKSKQCDQWSKTGFMQMGGTGLWKQCPNQAHMRLGLSFGILGSIIG